MNSHTVGALDEAAFNLHDEATRCERSAAHHRELAEAYEAKARGLQSAADVIRVALAEDAAEVTALAADDRTGQR